MAIHRTHIRISSRLLLPLFAIVLLLLSPAPVQATDYQTKIWINKVPAYSQLSKCAEQPISTIVRAMESGCGDGSRFTSYACFCTSSFFKFRFDISTAVVANCGTSLKAQVTSAVQVFDDYCAIGLENAQLVPTTYGKFLRSHLCVHMDHLLSNNVLTNEAEAAMITTTKAAQSTSYITAAPVRETGAS